MNKIALLMGALVMIGGCASDPGIALLAPGKYLITRQAPTGFSGLAGLKVKALREAADYCSHEHRVINVLSTKDSAPPYIFGNYPRTEIEFSCIAARS